MRISDWSSDVCSSDLAASTVAFSASHRATISKMLEPKASNMQDGWRTGDIAALELIASEGGALCTLMHIEGSYSREVGSHLAISRSGSVAGNLADGCLEAELANQSAQAAIEGCARIVRYGKGSPFIDFRLPCGAGIDILVDPLPDRRQEIGRAHV